MGFPCRQRFSKKIGHRAVLAAILSFFAFASPAFSKTVDLFELNGQLAPDYNSKIASLKDGDQLRLPQKGNTYRIVQISKRLGKGTNTWVFDIGEGKALRIPLKDDLNQRGTVIQSFIEWYFDGYQKLKNTGVPLVKVYEAESYPPAYITVEKLDHPITLREMLDTSSQNPALAELDEFARKTWKLRRVGDLNASQIAYVKGRGWLLMDYNHVVRPSGFIEDGTVFSYMNDLPWSWKTKLEALVTDERKIRGMPRGRGLQNLMGCFRRYIAPALPRF